MQAADATEIVLHFSNNVAESTVCDGNIAKIHLQKADGTPVEATVWVVDTQVDREKRRYIFVTPDAELAPGAYKVVIDPGITAKNGSSAETGFTVSFTVAGAAANPAGNNGSGTSPWIWIGIGAVAVVAVAALMLIRKPKDAAKGEAKK